MSSKNRSSKHSWHDAWASCKSCTYSCDSLIIHAWLGRYTSCMLRVVTTGGADRHVFLQKCTRPWHLDHVMTMSCQNDVRAYYVIVFHTGFVTFYTRGDRFGGLNVVEKLRGENRGTTFRNFFKLVLFSCCFSHSHQFCWPISHILLLLVGSVMCISVIEHFVLAWLQYNSYNTVYTCVPKISTFLNLHQIFLCQPIYGAINHITYTSSFLLQKTNSCRHLITTPDHWRWVHQRRGRSLQLQLWE